MFFIQMKWFHLLPVVAYLQLHECLQVFHLLHSVIFFRLFIVKHILAAQRWNLQLLLAVRKSLLLECLSVGVKLPDLTAISIYSLFDFHLI